MLRPRRPDDLPACVELLRKVYEADAYPVNWPDDPTGWLDAGGSLGAWVAELNDAVVGHVRLRRAGDGPSTPVWSRAAGVPAARLGVVAQLVVPPQVRGRALGTALLDTAVTAATERGLVPVLDVLEKDRAARALYERNGWTPVGMLRQQWDQTPVTVHLYVLRELVLSGGNTTPVSRHGSSVLREAGAWTPTIHALLRHVRDRGVSWAPEPRGVGADGREVLEYVTGDVHGYPMSDWLWERRVLVASAGMLRQLHDHGRLPPAGHPVAPPSPPTSGSGLPQ